MSTALVHLRSTPLEIVASNMEWEPTDALAHAPLVDRTYNVPQWVADLWNRFIRAEREVQELQERCLARNVDFDTQFASISQNQLEMRNLSMQLYDQIAMGHLAINTQQSDSHVAMQKQLAGMGNFVQVAMAQLTANQQEQQLFTARAAEYMEYGFTTITNHTLETSHELSQLRSGITTFADQTTQALNNHNAELEKTRLEAAAANKKATRAVNQQKAMKLKLNQRETEREAERLEYQAEQRKIMQAMVTKALEEQQRGKKIQPDLFVREYTASISGRTNNGSTQQGPPPLADADDDDLMSDQEVEHEVEVPAAAGGSAGPNGGPPPNPNKEPAADSDNHLPPQPDFMDLDIDTLFKMVDVNSNASGGGGQGPPNRGATAGDPDDGSGSDDPDDDAALR